jgi:hypothetical protein
MKGHMDTILKTATYDMENKFQVNIIYNKSWVLEGQEDAAFQSVHAQMSASP